MSRLLTNKSKRAPAARREKPFYGWRYLKRLAPDGTEVLEQIPLTLEDVLHPQENDQIPEHPYHETDKRYLCGVCHSRESRLDRGLVLCDCLVDWGIPGLGNHSPDISLFVRLKVIPRPKGTFRLRPSGGRCLAAIEIVSPDTRRTDVKDKLREYHQAKVPLYVIIDRKKEDGPRELRAYRYRADGYKQITLDARGCVAIKALGIRIGLKDERAVCYDLDTDKEIEIGDVTQEAQARAAAEQARAHAEQQIREQSQRIQELEAELRRREHR